MHYSKFNSLRETLNRWISLKRDEIFIIEGPSQIGKTYLINELMRFHHNIIYIDVKSQKDLINNLLNDSYLSPENFYSSLAFALNYPVPNSLSTVVFDGIEFCPPLRQYFKTLLRHEYVNIVAVSCGGRGKLHYGDLLTPSEESVHTLMPLTFHEFLIAIGKDGLANYASQSLYANQPLSDLISSELYRYFKIYNLIGGFPSTVEFYIQQKDINSCIQKNNEIFQKQIEHLKETYTDTTTIENIKEKFPNIILKNNFKAVEEVTAYKLKQAVFFMEEEYLLSISNAVDLLNTDNKSSSRHLFYFHQCFKYALNEGFDRDGYFKNVYPDVDDILTDYFFNQRIDSKPLAYGINREKTYKETDALFYRGRRPFIVEVKNKRLNLNSLYSFDDSEKGLDNGIVLFNGNYFHFSFPIILPSYTSCYFAEYFPIGEKQIKEEVNKF